MKAMPEGFLSTHLVGGVAPGTVACGWRHPRASSSCRTPAPGKVLFLTAGPGVTPVMSMLRTLARRGQITDIVHLHSAPTEADVIFAEELAQLAKDHPGYQPRVRATRTEGRLDLSKLDDEVADWRTREAWACGPEAMLHDAEREYEAAGSQVRLHLERFAASKAAVEGTGGSVTFERQRQDRRRRCGDVADGSRRKGRRADAVRLPDGHLPVLCGGFAGGPRPGSCARARNANREAGSRPVFRLRPGLCTGYWTAQHIREIQNLLPRNLRLRRLR